MADRSLEVLRDPDQATRRAELAAFIGPNAPVFLESYDALYASANRPAGQSPKFAFFVGGFCTAAFFLGPIWLFYRKLWAWAVGLTLVMLALGLIPIAPRGVGIGLSAGLAVAGRRLYVQHAINRVAELRAAGAGPAELAKAGGVSVAAGWTAGIVYFLLIGFAFVVALRAGALVQ